MGQSMFGNYTMTTCNFFVITMHYVNVVSTPTVVAGGLKIIAHMETVQSTIESS